jgi:sterol 3beta-glucosyltransferase
MTTVVLTTTGAAEDLTPFIALADEFRRRGIDSHFAVQAHLRPHVEAYGFRVSQLGPDSLGELYEAAAPALQAGGTSEAVDRYAEAMFEAAPAAFTTLTEVCAGSGALISSILLPLGRMVHEFTATPFVAVQVHNPIERIPNSPELIAMREQLGLPPGTEPAPKGVSPMHGYSFDLTLVATSPTVLRTLLDEPLDWPETVHAPGYFFLPEPEHADEDLAAFLADGPVVVFAMGERRQDQREETIALYRSAAESLGCRAVLRDPWTTVRAEHGPRLRAVGAEVPEQWLFQRAAAVVHDSDGGVTGSAFRAGVPTVPIPCDPSLRGWARAAESLGCTASVVPFDELGPERLADALSATLTNENCAKAALVVRDAIAADAGVAGACAAIEPLLR